MHGNIFILLTFIIFMAEENEQGFEKISLNPDYKYLEKLGEKYKGRNVIVQYGRDSEHFEKRGLLEKFGDNFLVMRVVENSSASLPLPYSIGLKIKKVQLTKR